MSVRRLPVIALAWVLVVTLLEVSGSTLATAAGGPSVGQPGVPSTPVQQQATGALPPDHAGGRALTGDQPAGAQALDGANSPTATSLSPSATWEVSGQTGDFTWSYPLRVPPAPGGLQPSLALSYSSSAVDGRTTVTNNQPSWVGDGWDLNPGFVERTYGGCLEDKEGSNPGQKVGDLCWRSDNAVAAYGDGGGMLIRDAATGVWRPRNDDGARIERFTGGGNGDNDGEHWKITTVDGTQFFYGSRPDAKSTWTVPVFGDDTGEPCHQATFASSHCTQAWRWNLDKVVDRHGNMMVFDYDLETNSYGRNLEDAAASYVRGGTLKQIEYGLHTQHAVPAAGRVVFGTADRCVPGSTCTFDKPDNWPDTALSERCVVATCKDRYSPTFWSTKRLASVTTQVRRGSAYADVDRWTLEQAFPDPGDGEKAALWLRSITHTGLVGGSAALPPVTFHGVQMPNRIYQTDGLSPLIRYRITGIISEAGGVVSVNYAPPECTAPQTNPESNTKRCFPVRWAKFDHAERTDYFHKYVVSSVVSSDRISSNPSQLVSYEYLDGVAWHYDESEFTPKDKRTWSEFRGFGRVRTRAGRTPDPGGPVTMSEQRFHRGMHGDRLNPSGGTKTVTLTDSEGGTHTDHDWLNGFARESINYLGESGPVVSKTITDPVWQGPTATRGDYQAYIVKPGTQRGFTALESGGWRRTRTDTTYDNRGLPTVVNDLGDTSLASDDQCTRTSYVRNETRWLLNFPSRAETVSVHCGVNPVYPGHAVSDKRQSYDRQAWGAAPTTGNATKVDELQSYPASGPVYTSTESRHDAHGRVVEAIDALDRITRTAFTPATGGPATQTVVTNPAGHATTTVLEPAIGLARTITDANDRITETAYDALGRVAEVWLPNRPRSSFASGNARFGYQVRRDEPTVVTTTRIGPNGNDTSSNTLYDGLLRTRQVQEPAAGGGRLITDTRYDSQGRVYKSTKPYFNAAAVDSSLWVASDVEVPGLTSTEYDGAGRPTASIFKGGGIEKWRTTTTYGGDREHVTPPAGGTATTTVTDARGRTVQRQQHHATTPTGPADVTRYSYTPSGSLRTLTDPAGNVWTFSYDLLGRRLRSDDPDKGVTTSSYDHAGQVTSQTDARGKVLLHSYDALGRKTATRAGSATGPLVASWTYDTVPYGKGQPATAVRYVGGHAYTHTVHNYTAMYMPRSTSLTIPESEGLLAGTYTNGTRYNVDGTIAAETFPALGGLFGETVSYTYDDFGPPLATTGGPEGSTVEYVRNTEYTRYGEKQRVHLGSGTKRAWLSYYFDDHTRRVNRTIVDAEVPNPMQADLNYTHDPAGNVTSIANRPIGQVADQQCYRYDYLRRLTEAWTPGNDCLAAPSTGALAGPAPYWHSFGYDLTGNRRGETRHGAGGDTVRSYAHPTPGPDAVRPHAVSSMTATTPAGTSTTSYAYDAAGNTTVRGDQRLSWDDLGRLDTLTENGATTAHVYDAAGMRIVRRDATFSTLSIGAQEVRVNRATGAVTGTRYYRHGGSVVAVRTDAVLTWLASDHNGTAEVAIDAAGLTTRTRRHDVFGNPRGAVPSGWPGEKGFVGGTTDPSGLTHLGAREYDPDTGRFVSVDPVLDPKEPQQSNAYAYSNNNPATLSDPSGMIAHYDDESLSGIGGYDNPNIDVSTCTQWNFCKNYNGGSKSGGSKSGRSSYPRSGNKCYPNCPRKWSPLDVISPEPKPQPDLASLLGLGPPPEPESGPAPHEILEDRIGGRDPFYKFTFPVGSGTPYHWSYELVRAPVYLAMAELMRCFNCNFPVAGAPAHFPAEGEYAPLNACPLIFCEIDAPVRFYSMPRGFYVVAQEGHIDPPGSVLTFEFSTDAKGRLELTTTAYVDDAPIPDELYKIGAYRSWSHFANNMGNNLMDYQHGARSGPR